jgi:hypothetical protein
LRFSLKIWEHKFIMNIINEENNVLKLKAPGSGIDGVVVVV